MRDEPFDPIDPAEARVAERVQEWLDQAVVPIDAAVVARAAATTRPRTGWRVLTVAYTTRLAAAAAVLAIALGGALLLAGRSPSMVPSGQPSPSVSPAQAAGDAPVEFTGSFGLTDCDAPVQDVSGEAQTRDAVCPLVIVGMSDPRLTGAGELRVHRDPREGGFALSMVSHRIENEGGAWQELPGPAIEQPGGQTSTRTIILRGEGGYAGRSVVAELSPGDGVWQLHGYVIEGEPPAAVASGPPME